MARLLVRLPLALCAAALLSLSAAASVSANTTAYDEPAFTKTSSNNSWWFRWQAVDGLDEAGNTRYEYYLCFRTSRDGITEETHAGANGPGSQNCTSSLRNGPTPSSGDYGVYPYSGPTTVLNNGSAYMMCAQGFHRYPHFPWRALGGASCEVSRIDRTKPSVAIGSNAATNNPSLPFRIDYSDAVSPPWPANYRCIKPGSACTSSDQFQYDPNCSVPAGNGFQFFCNVDASSAPDGRYYFCAAASDSAIPDNPSGPNQFIVGSRPVNSSDANISDFQCGSTLLDRVSPQASIAASATTVKVGDLVTLNASATDDSSGLAGGYTWTFGDNTPNETGSTVSHTYTQVGTFQVKLATQDAAGNPGTATTNITVQSQSSGAGAGGSTGGSLGGAPTTTQIVNQVGGGGTQKTAVGGLRLLAPKRLSTQVCKKKAGRRRCKRLTSLPLVLSPNDAGKVDLALVRGTKVVAKSAATFKFAGTFGLKMKLPRKLKAGKYSLRIAYTPRSGPVARKALKLKVVAPRRRRASRRAAAATSGSRPKLRGASRYKPDITALRKSKRPIPVR